MLDGLLGAADGDVVGAPAGAEPGPLDQSLGVERVAGPRAGEGLAGLEERLEDNLRYEPDVFLQALVAGGGSWDQAFEAVAGADRDDSTVTFTDVAITDGTLARYHSGVGDDMEEILRAEARELLEAH